MRVPSYKSPSYFYLFPKKKVTKTTSTLSENASLSRSVWFGHGLSYPSPSTGRVWLPSKRKYVFFVPFFRYRARKHINGQPANEERDGKPLWENRKRATGGRDHLQIWYILYILTTYRYIDKYVRKKKRWRVQRVTAPTTTYSVVHIYRTLSKTVVDPPINCDR